MHPKQLALIEGALDAIAGGCVRSAVATLNAGHLKAVLVEHLLRAGAGVVERGASSSEGRLLRMGVDDVVRVERVAVDRPPLPAPGARPRVADLRVIEPVALALELWSRSALVAPDRTGPRALLERFGALAAGSADALVIACDRRAWDALRVERAAEGETPSELSRLCAALLPPSSALGPERTRSEARVGGRGYGLMAVVTPMVFGAQRVVAAVWPGQRRVAVTTAAQMDAFEASA
jgi:hypothetical protein